AGAPTGRVVAFDRGSVARCGGAADSRGPHRYSVRSHPALEHAPAAGFCAKAGADSSELSWLSRHDGFADDGLSIDGSVSGSARLARALQREIIAAEKLLVLYRAGHQIGRASCRERV